MQLNVNPFKLYQTKPGEVKDITDQIPTNGNPVVFIDREVLFVRKDNILNASFFETGIVVTAKRYFVHDIQQYYFDIFVQVPKSYEGRTRGLFGELGNDDDDSNDLYTKDGVLVTGTQDPEVNDLLLSCK